MRRKLNGTTEQQQQLQFKKKNTEKFSHHEYETKKFSRKIEKSEKNCNEE